MEYTWGAPENGVSLVALDEPFEGRSKGVMYRILRRVPSISTNSPSVNGGIRVLMGTDQHRYNGIPWNKARGYRFEDVNGPVVCTWHPGYVGAGRMHLLPVVIHDVMRAAKELSLDAPIYPLEDLVLYPSPQDFQQWLERAAHGAFMAYDIETAYSRQHEEDDEEQDSSYEITRCSFADDTGNAITVPYRDEYITMIKDFLQCTNIPLVGWNSHEFDNPRVRAAGWKIDGHKLIDARWLWHFLQPTLPQSLGTVTTFYTRIPEWKSIGSSRGTEDELYSAIDAWATVQCYIGIKNALEKRGLL